MFCLHEWVLKEDSVNREKVHICRKCGKLKIFNKVIFKHQSTYVFCPKCGYELTRNSAVDQINKTKSGLEIWEYKCNRCDDTSYFNYTIAPVAIQVTKDGYIKT